MNGVATKQTFRQQMSQIAVAGEMFRRTKHRIKTRVARLRKGNLQIAFVRNFARVEHRLRHFGETRLHLLRAAQIKLLRHIARAHALGIAQQILRADAHQAVMRVRMAFLDIMHVIRRHAFQTKLLREDEQLLVHFRLLGNTVILQFEEKIFSAQRLLEKIHRIARLGDLIFHDQIGNFARETAGHRDQARAEFRENFFVNARLVVVAVQMCSGRELD